MNNNKSTLFVAVETFLGEILKQKGQTVTCDQFLNVRIWSCHTYLEKIFALFVGQNKTFEDIGHKDIFPTL